MLAPTQGALEPTWPPRPVGAILHLLLLLRMCSWGRLLLLLLLMVLGHRLLHVRTLAVAPRPVLLLRVVLLRHVLLAHGVLLVVVLLRGWQLRLHRGRRAVQLLKQVLVERAKHGRGRGGLGHLAPRVGAGSGRLRNVDGLARRPSGCVCGWLGGANVRKLATARAMSRGLGMPRKADTCSRLGIRRPARCIWCLPEAAAGAAGSFACAALVSGSACKQNPQYTLLKLVCSLWQQRLAACCCTHLGLGLRGRRSALHGDTLLNWTRGLLRCGGPAPPVLLIVHDRATLGHRRRWWWRLHRRWRRRRRGRLRKVIRVRCEHLG